MASQRRARADGHRSCNPGHHPLHRRAQGRRRIPSWKRKSGAITTPTSNNSGGLSRRSTSGARSSRLTQRAVDQTLATDLKDYLDRDLPSGAIGVCERLVGRITKQDRIDAVLGPEGPKLAAAEFHPWVWEAAPRWDAGFHRDAVQAAATRIFDVELPKKLGVQPSKNPADLFSAFAPDKTAPPLLRFPDLSPGDPSWASVHKGVMHVGQGCVMAPFGTRAPTG